MYHLSGHHRLFHVASAIEKLHSDVVLDCKRVNVELEEKSHQQMDGVAARKEGNPQFIENWGQHLKIDFRKKCICK
jgi:hypothetical protein